MKTHKMFRGIIAYGIVGALGLASTALAGKPTAVCRNGIAEPGEGCDGTDLRGATCESEGFTGGTAFPATGQRTCYNSAGAVISCAGTGQDGDIQAGAPLSYTDNGDGT